MLDVVMLVSIVAGGMDGRVDGGSDGAKVLPIAGAGVGIGNGGGEGSVEGGSEGTSVGAGVGMSSVEGNCDGPGVGRLTLKLPAVPVQVSSAPPLKPPTLQDTSLLKNPPHTYGAYVPGGKHTDAEL